MPVHYFSCIVLALALGLKEGGGLVIVAKLADLIPGIVEDPAEVLLLRVLLLGLDLGLQKPERLAAGLIVIVALADLISGVVDDPA